MSFWSCDKTIPAGKRRRLIAAAREPLPPEIDLPDDVEINVMVLIVALNIREIIPESASSPLFREAAARFFDTLAANYRHLYETMMRITDPYELMATLMKTRDAGFPLYGPDELQNLIKKSEERALWRRFPARRPPRDASDPKSAARLARQQADPTDNVTPLDGRRRKSKGR
jgi:hypothetical protein